MAAWTAICFLFHTVRILQAADTFLQRPVEGRVQPVG